MEVLFYADSAGQPNNINTIELPNCQPSTYFKGGSSLPNTLCCISNDYIISALPKKSVLNVFELNRRSQQSQKIVTPGVVKSLCVSNDGFYIAAGIAERILVWNAKSGELLSVLSKHYQDVTVLRFTSDGSFLVASGLDGLISVWNMGIVVNTWSAVSKDPTFCWSCHSLAVSQLYCSHMGGGYSRIFSSSLDRTIKIHDLASGTLLITLVFPSAVTAFCVNYLETMIVAGGYDGHIFKVDFTSVAKTIMETKVTSININPREDTKQMILKGHTQSVTCICFNVDATIFISGSADKLIKVWDVQSNQTIHTINAKDSITNLLLIFTPPGLTSTEYKPRYPFPKLARALEDPNNDEKLSKVIRLDDRFYEMPEDEIDLQSLRNQCVARSSDDQRAKLQELNIELSRVKEINRRLYEYAVDNLMDK